MTDITAAGSKKILGIGATGLIGSRVSEILKHIYPVTNLSTKTGVNITDPATLSVLNEDNGYSHVILFAAKSDVDGCERDRLLLEEGDAWKINVSGAKNVATSCKAGGKKIIYISTDFVFGGDNTPLGGYTEDGMPCPVNWYGVTKYDGEKEVISSGAKYVILRIAYPYRTPFFEKKDFVRAISDRLLEGSTVKAVTDHIMTPTYVDDVATAIQKLIETNAEGIYHAVGSEFVSPYEAALFIAGEFGFEKNMIEKTTRAEFFAGRAPRPFNLSLRNDKIGHLGVRMKTFREGLAALKSLKI